jgi:hypothetical protein
MTRCPSPRRSEPPAQGRRRPVRSALASALAMAFLALTGCAEPPDAPPLAPDPLSPEETARAVELGAPAAGALAEGLVGRLAQAMDEEGVAGAVTFCAEAAIPLTHEIQEGQGEGVTLKRATLRWRNPDNAPDEWEERVLRYLEAVEGFDPDLVPAELTARGPGESLRYYRVLRAAPMCLNCHGDEGALDPEVRAHLQEWYPDDRAVGYEAGELRGVIRVDIPTGP